MALLEKYFRGIGWATGSSVHPHVHRVSLDGVAPVAQSTSLSKYPLQIEYPFVCNKNRLNNRAKGPIDFVFCEQGREILQANELVSATRK